MTGRLRLHLGCAGTVVPGWENIDKSPGVYLARLPRLRRTMHRIGVLGEVQAKGLPTGIIHADVSKHLRYPDDSVEYVYNAHLIEHMSRWQALDFVRECRRVLMPGGVMRTATPDLAAIIRRYQEGDAGSAPTPADNLMSGMAMFQEPEANLVQRMISRNLSASHHQWLYDRDSLTALCLEGGMTEPHLCSYREGEVPDLEQLEQRPDSIFLEVRSP